MSPDLVIRGGTVVDGTGAPGRRADVAVEDGRVSAIGSGLDGKRVLDASGCIVSPGFIDIHTHYDAQVFWDPALTPSCYHGVTTVVAGNCGFSIAPTRPEHRSIIARTLEKVEDMDVAALEAGVPWDFCSFPEYLGAVERQGVGLNFAAYVGHSAVRIYVMGDAASARAATPSEREQMTALVDEAMRAGAAGFSTSFAVTHSGADGRPVPSRHADRAEVEALFRTVGASRRGIVEMALGDQVPLADVYEMQRSVGVPMSYGALLTGATGAHWTLMELNQRGWAAGAEVWPQVTCRPVTFSMPMSKPFTLNPNPEFAALVGVSCEERRRAYASADWRRRVVERWKTLGDLIPRWETFDIAESPANPQLVGRRLEQIATERGISAFDALMDLALDEPDLDLRVRCVMLNDHLEDLDVILQDEHCTLGASDAGAHVGMLCDAPAATDFLGHWVRDRSLMPIEKAVRKLTGVQADLFNFSDRGYLRPGLWADVAVFDPETVAPGPVRRVADFPAGTDRLTADQPIGVRHVLVNGTPIRLDGEQVDLDDGPLPGRVVRPAAR